MLSLRRAKLKIYGERNCGTRLLQSILSENSSAHLLSQGHSFVGSDLVASFRKKFGTGIDGRTLQILKDRDTLASASETLGWKHAFPHTDYVVQHKDTIVVLLVSKHPFFWARSLQKRAYAHYSPQKFSDLTFEEYLRALYIPSLRENAPDGYYPSVLAAYNAKFKAYLDLAKRHKKVLFAQYESILAEPDRVLKNLKEITGSSKDYAMPLSSTKGDNLQFADYAKKYDVKLLAELMAPHQKMFETHMSERLLQKFGYSLKPPFIKKTMVMDRLVP